MNTSGLEGVTIHKAKPKNRIIAIMKIATLTIVISFFVKKEGWFFLVNFFIMKPPSLSFSVFSDVPS